MFKLVDSLDPYHENSIKTTFMTSLKKSLQCKVRNFNNIKWELFKATQDNNCMENHNHDVGRINPFHHDEEETGFFSFFKGTYVIWW